MKMYFRTQDLMRLELLGEKQLYILNRELLQRTSEYKRSCMASKNLICEMVGLTETAAKEIACRNRWSPRTTNGEYSQTGITYETDEYRRWLRENRDTVCDNFDFLEQFSFWDEFLSLTRA